MIRVYFSLPLMIPFFHVLAAYLVGLVSFLILDGIMISQVILPLFRKHVGYLVGDMDIAAAVVFYLLYVLVGNFLVVAPAINAHVDWWVVARNGALFGFGAYMTYELTSKSFVKGWSYQMVLLDTIWGTLLTMIVCLVMWQILAWLR